MSHITISTEFENHIRSRCAGQLAQDKASMSAWYQTCSVWFNVVSIGEWQVQRRGKTARCEHLLCNVASRQQFPRTVGTHLGRYLGT